MNSIASKQPSELQIAQAKLAILEKVAAALFPQMNVQTNPIKNEVKIETIGSTANVGTDVINLISDDEDEEVPPFDPPAHSTIKDESKDAQNE